MKLSHIFGQTLCGAPIEIPMKRVLTLLLSLVFVTLAFTSCDFPTGISATETSIPSETNTSTPLPTSTATPIPPTEIPAAHQVVLMSAMHSVEDCNAASNTITFDPNNMEAYHAAVKAFLASVVAQTPNPSTPGRLRIVGEPWSNNGSPYTTFDIQYENIQDNKALPFATCGNLVMGEHQARINVVWIPWPEADHPLIPIAIGTEHNAFAAYAAVGGIPNGSGEYQQYYSDTAVFSSAHDGDSLVQLIFDMCQYPLNSSGQAILQSWETKYGYALTHFLFAENNADFNQKLADVLQGNANSATLQWTREYLQEHIISGAIRSE